MIFIQARLGGAQGIIAEGNENLLNQEVGNQDSRGLHVLLREQPQHHTKNQQNNAVRCGGCR